MKNQLFLLAALGGALAVAAPQVEAQATAPLPATQFNPDTDASGNGLINQTGLTAKTITVSGIIPEFIQFTSVDNQLEFGDMGGPTNTGLAPNSNNAANAGFVASQAGNSYTSAGTFVYPSAIGVNLTTGQLNQTPDGKAAVQFKSNAYIVIVSKADPMRNVGPDGNPNTADDIVLTTGFVRRFRGVAAYAPNSTPVATGTTGLSSLTFTQSNPLITNTVGYQQGYSTPQYVNASANNTIIEQIVFKPGSPFPAPYDSNGYWLAARVKRNGLNDYRGNYVGKVNLTYYKF